MATNKKVSSKAIIIIVIAVIAVAAISVYLLTADSRSYANAKKLEESGAYAEAISVYTQIGDYQDSSDRIKACQYGIAEGLLAEGKYEEAYDAYSAVCDYQNSSEQMTACKYGMAGNLMAAGKYSDAYDMYTSIADYSDVGVILSSDENLLFVADHNDKLAAFSTVGSIVTFGTWEQDNITDNDTEPIEWIVVAVDGTKSLLVSRYSIAYRPFANSFKAVTWYDSPLRKWLNSNFLSTAFTSTEQEHLIPVNSACDSSQSNSGYGTRNGY